MPQPEGKSTARHPRRRHLLRHITLWLCLTVVVIVAAGYPIYVRPHTDPLQQADAILVLGGAGYGRYPFGIALGAEGWAPTVVVSNPNGAEDPWLTEVCATPKQKFDLRCFVPDPRTTRGEGQQLRQLAAEHGWQKVIVVTYRPHISRARFILQRCFDGELIMVASPGRVSWRRLALEYVYQTAGYLRTLLQPGC